MKRQETRFSYVYEDLKKRIASGQFRPGSRLPSSRNLCEEYNVGIATITRVLDTLKAEKLIDIQIRQAPVVLPDVYKRQGIPCSPLKISDCIFIMRDISSSVALLKLKFSMTSSHTNFDFSISLITFCRFSKITRMFTIYLSVVKLK